MRVLKTGQCAITCRAGLFPKSHDVRIVVCRYAWTCLFGWSWIRMSELWHRVVCGWVRCFCMDRWTICDVVVLVLVRCWVTIYCYYPFKNWDNYYWRLDNLLEALLSLIRSVGAGRPPAGRPFSVRFIAHVKNLDSDSKPGSGRLGEIRWGVGGRGGQKSLGFQILLGIQKNVWGSKLGLKIKKSLGFKTLFGNQNMFGVQNLVRWVCVWHLCIGAHCSFVRHLIPPRFEQLSVRTMAPDTKKRHRIQNLESQIIGLAKSRV